MIKDFVILAFKVTEPNSTSGVGLNGSNINFGVTNFAGFSTLVTFLAGGVMVICKEMLF